MLLDLNKETKEFSLQQDNSLCTQIYRLIIKYTDNNVIGKNLLSREYFYDFVHTALDLFIIRDYITKYEKSNKDISLSTYVYRILNWNLNILIYQVKYNISLSTATTLYKHRNDSIKKDKILDTINAYSLDEILESKTEDFTNFNKFFINSPLKDKNTNIENKIECAYILSKIKDFIRSNFEYQRTIDILLRYVDKIFIYGGYDKKIQKELSEEFSVSRQYINVLLHNFITKLKEKEDII